MNDRLILIIGVVLCAISVVSSLLSGYQLWQLIPVFFVLWCSYVIIKNRQKNKNNK
ncbi:hypothetical protein M2105_003733 [Paenibacillus sp. PastF-1]|nr:hypothetical protein [Paenibacillus sp. PastF-2]MDF9849425.1 hypothetical protein [Paenibacillus sp. PastM-2]MDF9855867.1 hypothetical protein [Paenibacillus sp. PastF-1]MDH6481267.1 hypothetical protein [Paenibacillus sp. PastH-2]MDH6508686.1 hypothetical protein [Paenibacillus sp. PastM-3]